MMISHIKLLVSVIIAGMFILIIRQASLNLREQSHEQVSNAITAHRAQHITDLLQFDLKRIGMSTNGQAAIVTAEPHRIVFNSDLDLDGTVETISYYLSDSSAASATDNPSDKILYRVVDNEPEIDVPLGVTEFELKYYNWTRGEETTDLDSIRTIEVILELQNTYSIDDDYSGYAWRTSISPPNLMLN